MKGFLIILISTTLVAFNSIVWAGGLFHREVPSHCQKKDPSYASTELEYNCQCTDLGMYYNSCIDKKTSCHVFGNVGGWDS